jgi:tetratricopeptide (TPR) repeat protein
MEHLPPPDTSSAPDQPPAAGHATRGGEQGQDRAGSATRTDGSLPAQAEPEEAAAGAGRGLSTTTSLGPSRQVAPLSQETSTPSFAPAHGGAAPLRGPHFAVEGDAHVTRSAAEAVPDADTPTAPPELRPGAACCHLATESLATADGNADLPGHPRAQDDSYPTRAVEDGSSDGPAAAPSRAALPRVGGYEILGVLGRGGMGVVYKARQPSLKRLVAVKMIRADEVVRGTKLDRFQAEAELVARLRHPNIVQIHEAGEHDGRPFFSLELVEGGSLSHKLQHTPQDPEDAARLCEVLARAMHYAHEAGIVHRDLKPGNVLLTPEGTPKITDFGIAKCLDGDGGSTLTGDIIGTPSYMPPEQAGAPAGEVGPAADIWALGAILYEMLTGGPPFRGKSRWHTLEQVRTQEPVPPRQLQPAAPADLETVCLKCLRKEPGQRYASALALADDLHRFLAHEPIQARPVGRWERAVKWARRRPTQAALIVTAVLAVVGLVTGAVSFGLYQQAEALNSKQQAAHREQVLLLQTKSRREAERHLKRARASLADGQLALARAVGAEAAKQPRQAQLLEDEAARHLTEAAQSVSGAQARLDPEQIPADDELRRDLQVLADQVRGGRDELNARRDLARKVEDFEARHDAVLFHALSVSDQEKQADAARVRRLAPEVLKVFAVPAEDPAVAGRALEPYRRHLEARQLLGRVAAGCYEVLLTWAEAVSLPGPQNPDATKAAGRSLRLLASAEALGQACGLATPRAFHENKARYLEQLGDKAGARHERQVAAGLPLRGPLDHFLAALQAYRQGQPGQAVSLCEALLRERPDHFWARYLQGLCHLRTQSWGRAREAFTACVDRRPEAFWPRLLRASARLRSGDFAGAGKDFEVALSEAPAGHDSLKRYLALTSRGGLYVTQKRWDEAVRDLREAAELRPEAHEAKVNLAQAYRGRGDLGAAILTLGDAIKQRPRDVRLYYTRAQIHLASGDKEAARGDLERVIALGAKSDLLASARVLLAHLKHGGGDYAGALADAEAAQQARAGFAPALLQKADSLLATGDYRAAGEALDQYLAHGQPTAKDYHARGLIHEKLRAYPQALQAYGRALMLKRDASTLSSRGWVYLRQMAVQSALADFEEGLAQDPGNVFALCGRAHANVHLGQLRPALEDVEKALRLGPCTDQLLLGAACVYAQAADRVRGAMRGGRGKYSEEFLRYAERAAELVGAAVEEARPQDRREFWRKNVEPESLLSPIRSSPAMLKLWNKYR